MQVAFRYIKQIFLTVICEIGIIFQYSQFIEKETDVQLNNLFGTTFFKMRV